MQILFSDSFKKSVRKFSSIKKQIQKKGDDEIVLCDDCGKSSNNTIKFIALGPHDQAYGKK